VLVVLAGLALILGVAAYNGLVGMRQLTRNAWSDVEVFLKRRAELIPNLVATVKAYASHEQETLERLAEARSLAAKSRSLAAKSRSVAERSVAEQSVTGSLTRVVALAEAYPELRSQANFLSLQQELKDTEKLLANARQYYNACVRDLNTKIESFPSNLVAGATGFRHEDFFQLDDANERIAPAVGDEAKRS